MPDTSALDEDLWPVALQELQRDVEMRQRTFGGRLFSVPGALGVIGAAVPVPCRVYEPTAALAPVITACRASDPPVPIHVVADHPDQQVLLDAGWSVEEHLTEMLLLTPTPERPLPRGVAIEPVAVPEGLEEFYSAMAQGFEAAPDAPEQWLPRAAIATQGVQLIVARDETGSVLGTAGLRPRGGGANLYAISVPPPHRGRGIGAALTAAAARIAFDRGAKLVHLQASPAGHPVYERAGFRVAGHWVAYSGPE